MKKTIILLCTILSLGLFSACDNDKNEDNTITLGFMSSLGAVPYVYALEEGFYEAAGINVEIKIFTNANDRDGALLGHHIDAVNTDYVMFANLLEQGHQLVATATTEDKFFIVANKNFASKITDDIESTNSAKVGTFENGVLSYLVEKLATDHGITYQQVGLPMLNARLAALEANEIDMAILPDPSASKVNGGRIIWDNIASNQLVTTLAFFKDFVKENEQLVKDFFSATDKAIEKLSKADEAVVKQYLVKHNLLTPEDAEIISLQTYHPLVLPSKENFDPVMEWMVAKSLIRKAYNLDDVIYDWKK